MERILIKIEGGLVSAVYATDPKTQIIIVDLDAIEQPIVQQKSPDDIFFPGYAHEFFESVNLINDQVRDELKTIKF